MYAQPLAPGDIVILSSHNSRGVPLHRTHRSSLIGYALNGTEAEIITLAAEGRWLHISMDTASAWIMADYVARYDPTSSPTSLDTSVLLKASCEEIGDYNLYTHDLFDVCFYNNWRIPLWTAYTLSQNAMSGPGDRKKSSWRQDERIRTMFQASDFQYTGTGFHRGHLAPAEAFTRTQSAVNFTHQFSNAIPQYGNVNSGAWSKLEKGVRTRVEQGEQLWVFTGALALNIPDHCQAKTLPPTSCFCLTETSKPVEPGFRMREQIVVPSHSFKVILSSDGAQWRGFGFILANVPRGAGNYLQYQYPIALIEELSGVDFFAALPDDIEGQVESSTQPLAPIKNKRVRLCHQHL